MAELPRHPETDDHAGLPAQRSMPSRPWLPYVIGVVVAALFVVMIVLHLSGAVGPGAH